MEIAIGKTVAQIPISVGYLAGGEIHRGES